MRRTRAFAPDELIGEPYQRHPAGARLSGPARPHREGDAVPAARRGAKRRRQPDRELSRCGRARRSPASIFAIPESYYFGVAKVERDQVEDYAAPQGHGGRRGRALARADPQLCARRRSPKRRSSPTASKREGSQSALRRWEIGTPWHADAGQSLGFLIEERSSSRESWFGHMGRIDAVRLPPLAPDFHEPGVSCCGLDPLMRAVRGMFEAAAST